MNDGGSVLPLLVLKVSNDWYKQQQECAVPVNITRSILQVIDAIGSTQVADKQRSSFLLPSGDFVYLLCETFISSIDNVNDRGFLSNVGLATESQSLEWNSTQRVFNLQFFTDDSFAVTASTQWKNIKHDNNDVDSDNDELQDFDVKNDDDVVLIPFNLQKLNNMDDEAMVVQLFSGVCFITKENPGFLNFAEGRPLYSLCDITFDKYNFGGQCAIEYLANQIWRIVGEVYIWYGKAHDQMKRNFPCLSCESVGQHVSFGRTGAPVTAADGFFSIHNVPFMRKVFVNAGAFDYGLFDSPDKFEHSFVVSSVLDCLMYYVRSCLKYTGSLLRLRLSNPFDMMYLHVNIGDYINAHSRFYGGTPKQQQSWLNALIAKSCTKKNTLFLFMHVDYKLKNLFFHKFGNDGTNNYRINVKSSISSFTVDFSLLLPQEAKSNLNQYGTYTIPCVAIFTLDQ